ncbi:uncharacterized protein METZ01_LOCUS12116 [marine metagenome]|uniref:Uncharacterized protein n=1 Tax=marine metagenome TaxID=408172 RepID=A0A381NXD1_9ZZZZ
MDSPTMVTRFGRDQLSLEQFSDRSIVSSMAPSLKLNP